MPKVAPEIAAGRVIVAHLGSGASMRTITTRMPGTATQPGANIELVEPLLDILDVLRQLSLMCPVSAARPRHACLIALGTWCD
jgi:hypothetical protein